MDIMASHNRLILKTFVENIQHVFQSFHLGNPEEIENQRQIGGDQGEEQKDDQVDELITEFNFVEFLDPLIEAWKYIRRKYWWRLEHKIIENLGNMLNLFTQKDLQTKIVP